MAAHGGHGHGHTHEDMLSVEDAYDRIMAYFHPLQAEEQELTSALGQVLSDNVYSPFDLPHLANSAMDGYAVRYDDFTDANGENRTLDVIGHVPAGQMPNRPVELGTAIRIMTGAPVPEGADTIVPFEETDEVERKGQGLGLWTDNHPAEAPQRPACAAGSRRRGDRRLGPEGGNPAASCRGGRIGIAGPAIGAGHPASRGLHYRHW